MCRACPICVCPAQAVAMSLLKCALCAVRTHSTVLSSPCRSSPWPRTTPVRGLTIPEDGASTASQCNSYYCLTFTVQRCFLMFKGTSHVPVCAHCTLFQYWTSVGRDKLLSLCTLPACVLQDPPKFLCSSLSRPCSCSHSTQYRCSSHSMTIMALCWTHPSTSVPCPGDPSWSSTAPLVLLAQLCLAQLGWLP